MPEATGFSGTKLFLKFDEFVSVKDAYTNITISPPLTVFPEFRTRGKGIVVEFQDTLRSDRTYCIDFGNSIQDITENNIFSNYRFVFSTGAHLDSMYIQGQVINAFSRQSETDISLFLYRDGSDSLAYSGQPDFLARSRPDGTFIFSSLPAGAYYLVAVQDKNANLRYDPMAEAIGFSDSLVVSAPMPVADTAQADSLRPATPVAPLKTCRLFLFTEKDTVQRLLKTFDKYTARFTMIFNAPVKDLRYRMLKGSVPGQWQLTEYNATRDTLTCWVQQPGLDSLNLELSDQNQVIDTLDLVVKQAGDSAQMAPVKKGGKGGMSDSPQAFQLSMTATASPQRAQELNRPLQIRFSHPLRAPETRGIRLEEVIDSTGFPLIASLSFSDTGVFRNLVVDFAWRSRTPYRLIIPKGQFTDIFGFTNDSLVLNFTSRDADTYGVLKVNVRPDSAAATTNTYSGNYIFQLINSKDEIVRSARLELPASLTYDFMDEGDYKARIVYDANRNGRWDTGNFRLRRQAEEVLYYHGNIRIKQNWDTETDWIIK